MAPDAKTRRSWGDRSPVAVTRIVVCALTGVVLLTLFFLFTTTTTARTGTHGGGRGQDGDTWPRVRTELCGQGYPNAALGELLFELAREEVFPNRTRFTTTRGPSNLVKTFFTGDWGASWYGHDPERPSLATIYVRVFKAANDAIRAMERELWRDYNGTHVMEEAVTVRSALEEAKKMKVEPCIYTAIRDPVSHFLAGYNEVEYRFLNAVRGQTCPSCVMTGEPPPYFFGVPYSNSSESQRRRRFTAFVKDFLREDTAFSSQPAWAHLFSMSRILVTLSRDFNARLTAYIPTLENLETTWPAFLSSTCPGVPLPEDFPKPRDEGHHESSRDPFGTYQAAKDVWLQGGEVANALCLLHAFDYACWTKLPEGVPKTCTRVYQRHAYRILGRRAEAQLQLPTAAAAVPSDGNGNAVVFALGVASVLAVASLAWWARARRRGRRGRLSYS
ncbi:hypothetical protein HOP50_18g81650 [Chloropicon primus]|uniref:Uncharacterized protein n=1 Tax=Chloropicon primus TaxID=1764295 RepID=A0A5B8MYD2_9CHLO|nr:hypothetical protein A3770_18p81410 [Chloropicon primus]UPR04820.1 hypothetical protein HOP50_18g81650 [Chloropicon primus]|eukprot:QDZ25623.1 hypothetical protein A3770_18p81410 [Chloropicon primus]